MQEVCDMEHQSSESEGLRFDSSWGLRSFFLYPTLMTRWKKTYFSNFKNVITYKLKVLSEENKIYPLHLQWLI